MPPGVPASEGPAQACISDKIDQFATELANPAAKPEERLVALKFLLHLVGDIHQPLHAADDHDAGGNRKPTTAGNLHHLWDVKFVERLGTDAIIVAGGLVAKISDQQRLSWSGGSPDDWAMETFALARDHAYALLPPPQNGVYVIGPDYVVSATRDTEQQLSKAGVRLAALLDRLLGEPRSPGSDR